MRAVDLRRQQCSRSHVAAGIRCIKILLAFQLLPERAPALGQQLGAYRQIEAARLESQVNNRFAVQRQRHVVDTIGAVLHREVTVILGDAPVGAAVDHAFPARNKNAADAQMPLTIKINTAGNEQQFVIRPDRRCRVINKHDVSDTPLAAGSLLRRQKRLCIEKCIRQPEREDITLAGQLPWGGGGFDVGHCLWFAQHDVVSCIDYVFCTILYP